MLTTGMDIQRIDLKKKAQRRRALAIGAAIVAVLGLAGFVATLDPAAPGVDRASLWTDTVRRGEMLREVRGPGTLVPKEIRWIAAASLRSPSITGAWLSSSRFKVSPTAASNESVSCAPSILYAIVTTSSCAKVPVSITVRSSSPTVTVPL